MLMISGLRKSTIDHVLLEAGIASVSFLSSSLLMVFPSNNIFQ
jgi:hypothetical protein